MPTNKRSPFPSKGFFGRKGAASFGHNVTVGAAGAITSQDSPIDSAVVVAKQGTAGQYLITLPSSFKRVLELDVALQGAITVATVGSFFDFETNNIDGGTAAGTILLQFRRPDTMAAADLPNPFTFTLTITVAIGV